MNTLAKSFSLLAVFALLGWAPPCGAQKEAKPETEAATKPAEEWVTKVIEVRHADVGRLAEVLKGVFRGTIKYDGALRVIAVYVPKDTLPAIEDVIKRFDVPPATTKNVELTAYLVVASEQSESSAYIPSELQPVIKQLKGIFAYQGFRLLDTLVLRSREGTGGDMSGVAPSAKSEGSPSAPTIYQLKFGSTRIASDEKGRIIWFNGLRLGTRVPIVTGGGFNYQDIGIAADVDVREGQKVVVGKSSIGGPDRSLFMVVSAKVTE